jgi:hypothetical protein
MMNLSGPWCAGFLSPEGGCAVKPQFVARTVGLIAAIVRLFIVRYVALRRREVRA